jgi:hypothetical protein
LKQTPGHINDTVTATVLAERLAGEGRLDPASAVVVLSEQMRRRGEDALRDLARRRRTFTHQRRFRA